MEAVRPNVRRERVLDGFQSIRSEVGSLEEAAERLGIKLATLDRALLRARHRGDDRGDYSGLTIVRHRQKFAGLDGVSAKTRLLITRYEEIAKPGLSLSEVAGEIGTTKNVLYAAIRRAREKGYQIQTNRPSYPATEKISFDVDGLLDRWVDLRQTGCAWEAAADLLDTDRLLFGAILTLARRRGDYRGNLEV